MNKFFPQFCGMATPFLQKPLNPKSVSRRREYNTSNIFNIRFSFITK